jgi:TatD DNase family protein
LLTDSHVHLHAYDDDEVAAMLARAGAAGVARLVAVSVDLASAARTVALAGRHDAVRAAVGLHPAELPGVPSDADWLALERLAEAPAVAAIGECGVDPASRASGPAQLAVLARHCRLATRLGRPLLLHLVGEDLIGPALGTLAATGVARGRAVAHYFQGDRFEANRLLEAGVLISVGKPAARLPHLRDALRQVPLDALLLETDTYPVPGRTTEPADVRLVAEAVAELKGLTLVEVAEATSANLARLLVASPPGG